MDRPAVPPKSPKTQSSREESHLVKKSEDGQNQGEIILDPSLRLPGEKYGKKILKGKGKGKVKDIRGSRGDDRYRHDCQLQSSSVSGQKGSDHPLSPTMDGTRDREPDTRDESNVQGRNNDRVPPQVHPAQNPHPQSSTPNRLTRDNTISTGVPLDPSISVSPSTKKGGGQTSPRLSDRFGLAWKSKPTLTKTWEKKAFTEEVKSHDVENGTETQGSVVDEER